MILAVSRMAPVADPATLAATATGLAPAEVRMRLAGIPPRILVRDADAVHLAAVAAKLDAAGFGTIRFELGDITSDAERILIRRLELSPGGLTAFDGADHAYACPAAAIELLQVGTRTTVMTHEETTTAKKFSMARAVVSGGLILRKTVTTKTQERSEESERFAVIQRRDGERDLVLYERRLHYQFLGAAMQPSSMANFQATASRIKSLAPHGFDDRMARPGFVSTLPALGVDPVDLGLHMVLLAHRSGVH